MTEMTPRFRLGFDIGGTFTDFVLVDEKTGATHLNKCLTTPDDPSRGVIDGLVPLLREADATGEAVDIAIHATTLITNALIERKGARTALLTTEGFRDVLEMGTEVRYDIYDLFLERPAPLAPRERRFEVAERLDKDGTVLTPLDEAGVRAVARRMRALRVEAVAVVFLHAFRNPAHEQRAAAILAEEMPGVSISVSSAVAPEIREYERMSTTVANAYAQPITRSYIDTIERRLTDMAYRRRLYLMISSGGIAGGQTAKDFPIRMLESGPTAGVLAAIYYGRQMGIGSLVTFDMGGTTAKIGLVKNHTASKSNVFEVGRVARFKKGSGLPVKVPMVELIEIGAGGGSIAAIDEVGLLKVGPRSAGSDPGPACYGMGGTDPTVTDANLVLGYYDPDFFLGGRMRLDVQAARRAVARVAEPLGLTVDQAALGIHKVVVESMAAAARVHLVEQGKDPRRYAMVGFGGAGPAHAADVARAMGVREVIVPPASGAASALGFLAAPLSHEGVRSMRVEFSPGFDVAAINRVLREIEAEGRRQLGAAGVDAAQVRVERHADMRLVGQMHDIAVPLPEVDLAASDLPALRESFARAYARRYTRVLEGMRFEAVNFRVRCAGPVPALTLDGAAGGADAAQRVKGRRRAVFEQGPVEAVVVDRYALRPGDAFQGPAIVEERESTTVVAPGDRVEVDAQLNLRITVSASRVPEPVVRAGMGRAEAVARIEADPIGLEIMWSRLVNVVDEMWLTVCRTAFSLVISEAQDFACELLDRDGETLAHSPRAMPVFNLTLPRAVKALLAAYPADTLKPGDVLITNDPWLCAGHLFDIAVVTPVFRQGRLVALTGTVGHVSDIGGTKDSLKAREIYEEGFQIPPMKLYDAGRLDETLVRLLKLNVRNGEQVLGDLQALVTANAIGAERLVAFMDDYGLEDLGALAEVVQGRSERAMREAIRALPDGEYRATVTNNPLGQVMAYPVCVRIRGDAIEIDFDGAPPQLPQGGLNCTLNYTAAHATYPLKCMLTPTVRGNAGCYRPFTVKAPEGSVLNCSYPVAVNLRTRTGWYLAPNIFRALAQAAPRQVQSFTGLAVAANVYGQDAAGRFYSDMLFCGGGQGGSARGDGRSALLWPTSAANTAIEMIESRAPVLVLEKTYVTDSGGPGRHRGGLGQRVRLRKRDDDGLPTLVSIYPEGVNNPIDGLYGGQPGGEALGRVLDAAGRELRDCGTGELVELKSAREVVELVLAGGSGYGPPEERPEGLLARDRQLGFVSDAGARQDYGRDGPTAARLAPSSPALATAGASPATLVP
jgi:5-oxoprolinase (ATP-hydrolysing)/N-methylhydantoinase A